ncbi:unnamed protein product [Rotaria magnacalcarata]|uniref:Ionotropic glutamate receptor L-glutamate and glycine-binding domain-containing protein n=1 Tax=Rotaria magnacalcarata TaxID=392030 RepID=A0A8S3HNV2_9BILA|nr:unnamed protein product [Rotaria magnacalcarata]
MSKLNFFGKLTFFDYQNDTCTINYQESLKFNRNSFVSRNLKRYESYYRTTLSFRDNSNSYKLLHSTQFSIKNSSSLLFDDINSKKNQCQNNTNASDKYFSYSYFNSQLPKSLKMNANSIFDGLNFIVRLLTLNIIDCKTYRLKQIKKKFIYCNTAYVNVFSTQKSSLDNIKKQIQLIGRYSTKNDEYQACYLDENKNLSLAKKQLSPKIYYITNVFDEPFLMLRKQTPLHNIYSQPQANLKELRGRTFGFDQVEGYCVDLAEKVCSILNITCQFRIAEDGRFGSKNKTTGIWDGK